MRGSWWWRLLRYGRPEKGSLALVVVLMLLGVGLELLLPWPLKLIVDSVLAGKPLPDAVAWMKALPGASSVEGLLGWLAAATVMLFLAARLVIIGRTYVQTGVGSRMIYGLASDLFLHLQKQSLLFHSRRRSGDLVRRVTADTQCARSLVIDVCLPVISAVVTLGAMFWVMWRMQPAVAWGALVMAVPLGICVRFFARPMTERRYREEELQGEILSLAEQTLTAMPVIQAFQRERMEDGRYRELAEAAVRANVRVTLSEQQFKAATGGVTAVATGLLMVLGGIAVLQGSLTVGSLIVLLAYFAALYSPLETLAYLTEGVASAAAGARRVFAVLDADEGEVREASPARSLPAVRTGGTRAIAFEGVTFGYEPGRPVLRELSFRVEAGEFVAVVGATGSGKSTLISLIPRFFDPWRGRVLMDGEDVRLVPVAQVRAQVALVLQDPFLLPLSVGENIAYGRPGAGREEVMAAAEAAQLGSFIERLPQGVDTVIGERGVTLSGGEKQRLSIARALLKDAPVVIMDEPSSALDSDTEAALMEAVRRLTRGRTTFVIAHRLSTVARADRVLALESGVLAERSVGRRGGQVVYG